MTTTLYSLPLDQTALHIHFVEVEVTYKGVDPDEEPEEDEDEDEDEDEYQSFTRSYCYVIPEWEDPDLRTPVFRYVKEDETEFEIQDMDIETIQADHVSEYPSNCTIMEKDLEDIFKEEFVRHWGEPKENNIFIKDDRLFSPDPTLVIFNGDLQHDWETEFPTKDELINYFKEELELDLQIHEV